MKPFAGVLAGAGAVWLAALVLGWAPQSADQSWPLATASIAAPVVLLGVLWAWFAPTPARVGWGLLGLWALVVAVGTVWAGPSLVALSFVGIYVTMGFAVWLGTAALFLTAATPWLHRQRPAGSSSLTGRTRATGSARRTG